jgi:hypothetical protein
LLVAAAADALAGRVLAEQVGRECAAIGAAGPDDLAVTQVVQGIDQPDERPRLGVRTGQQFARAIGQVQLQLAQRRFLIDLGDSQRGDDVAPGHAR